MPNLIQRIERLEQSTQSYGRGGGPLEFVEVRLSEPLEVREARIAEAEARAIAAGWYPGCGWFQCIIVELDDVTEAAQNGR